MSKAQSNNWRLRPARLLLGVLSLDAALIAALNAHAQPPAVATPSTVSKDAKSDSTPREGGVPGPELVALTWQYRRNPDGRRKQPVWHPDGTRLTDAETDDLVGKVKNLYNHYWQPDQLQPLVLVFRRVAPIETGLSVALVRDDGRRLWFGTWEPFRASGLAKSTCAPPTRDLPKWPQSADFDVRVPLEAPQTIKTLTEIPAGPVELAPGVRWYVDHDKGIDFKGENRREHLTAAVLEIEDESPENLVSYEAIVSIRGKDMPLSGGYVTIIEPKPGARATIRVSDPIDEVKTIEGVKFTRQRFKIQRFSGVKLRTDLLLPPDEAKPDSPSGAVKQRLR